jgi:hypothetical protein
VRVSVKFARRHPDRSPVAEQAVDTEQVHEHLADVR